MQVEWGWRERGLKATASQCKATKLLEKLGTTPQWNELYSVLLYCMHPNCPACYSAFYLWWK